MTSNDSSKSQIIQPAPTWDEIDTVLLDMDGTLLDLHFDTHFWLEHVPARYAEANSLSIEKARAQLMKRYRSAEGKLEWYCVDYWSDQLNLNIEILKQEVDHLISLRPDVISFLQALANAGKHRILVTNAHGKSLSLKMKKTPIGDHLDEIITAHDIGLPKESMILGASYSKNTIFRLIVHCSLTIALTYYRLLKNMASSICVRYCSRIQNSIQTRMTNLSMLTVLPISPNR